MNGLERVSRPGLADLSQRLLVSVMRVFIEDAEDFVEFISLPFVLAKTLPGMGNDTGGV